MIGPNINKITLQEWCEQNGEYGQKVLQEFLIDENSSKGIVLQELTKGSNKKVTWKCIDCGKIWIDMPYHRTKGKSCPICGRIKGIINSQKTHFKNSVTLYDFALKQGDFGKKLIADIDEEANKKDNISPKNVTYGSNKFLNWKCSKCGYKYKIPACIRAHRDCGCCAGKVVVVGINDAKTWCEKNGEIGKLLLSEFDKDENGLKGITLETITKGSNKQISWKCENGHKWVTSINLRISRLYKCPYCETNHTSYQERFIFHALSSIIPNMERNYRMPHRLGGYELDICIPEKKLVIEYNGSRWHRGIKDKSNTERKKTEICEQYGLRLIHINDGEGSLMPEINGDIISFIYDEKYRDEQLNKVVEILLKELCVENIIQNFESAKEKAFLEKRKVILERTLAFRYPKALSFWNYEKNEYIKPDTVSYGSNEKVYWKCKVCDYEWKQRIVNRADHDCPCCTGQVTVEGINDLCTVFPELAEEWILSKNSLKPSEISIGSIKEKIWWKCPNCSHEWQNTVNSRTNFKSGCPNCGYNWYKATIGEEQKIKKQNQLDITYPEIVKEWDYNKNEKNPCEFFCGSNQKVWWKCTYCSHEWSAEILGRTSGKSGCPNCSYNWYKYSMGQAQKILDITYPEIVKEWDYNKNEKNPCEFSCGSSQRVWWKCVYCSHEWSGKIANRTHYKSGCPDCGYNWYKATIGEIQKIKPKHQLLYNCFR